MSRLFLNQRGRLRRPSPARDAKHKQLREELAAARKKPRPITKALARVRMWWVG